MAAGERKGAVPFVIGDSVWFENGDDEIGRIIIQGRVVALAEPVP